MSWAPKTKRTRQKSGAWTKRKLRQERLRREEERAARTRTPGPREREVVQRYPHELQS